MTDQRLTIVFLLLFVFAYADPAGAGPESFPPCKPDPMPEFSIPAVGNALDEQWVFVDTLYDASPNRPDLFGAYPTEMVFAKYGRGYLATLHTVFRTDDHGESWTNLDLAPPPSINTTWQVVRNPYFIGGIGLRYTETPVSSGDSLLLAVSNGDGEDGSVRLIRNIGGSMALWFSPLFQTGNWITEVATPDHETIDAFAGLDGKIFRYDSTWTPFETDSIDFIDSTVVGDSTIYDTTFVLDSNYTLRWDTLNYNFFGTWVDDVESNDHQFIAAGSRHLTSEDGGETWMNLPAADPDGVRDLSFAPDSLHGLACGESNGNGWVRWTEDGGATWSERTLTTIDPLSAVCMVSSTVGYVGGGNLNTGNGRIHRTSDGGQTWELELLCDAEIRAISSSRWSAAYVNVVAAGAFPDFSCGIWRSRVFSPSDEGPVLAAFPDTLDFGMVYVGDRDTMSVTLRNVGNATISATGTSLSSPFFTSLWGVQIVEFEPNDEFSFDVVYAPVLSGTHHAEITILNTSMDDIRVYVQGTSEINAADPENPLLPKSPDVSIWPNPGNAEFGISYALPSAQTVSLVIYDLTGREVETLDRGQRVAGEHTVHWNGASQASGLYFVRLETDGGVRMTKKLMLVK